MKSFKYSAKSPHEMKSRIKHTETTIREYDIDPKFFEKTSLPVRGYVLYKDKDDLLTQLNRIDTSALIDTKNSLKRDIVFMFTGQGLLYPKICSEIYSSSQLFKSILDHYSQIAFELTGLNVVKILFNNTDSDAIEFMNRVDTSPVLLLTLQFVISKYLMLSGIIPDGFIGHSLGEYLSAVFAGALSFQDAIRIVHFRGKWMQTLPEGSMVSVPFSKNECRQYLTSSISLAADHGESCILSGPVEEIAKLVKNLKKQLIFSTMLNINTAGHSQSLRKYSKTLKDYLDTITFKKPMIRYFSSTCKYEINQNDVLDAEFWVDQTCSTVEFYSSVNNMLSQKSCQLLEIGPGSVLTGVVSNNLVNDSRAMSLIPAVEQDPSEDFQFFNEQLLRLWNGGFELNNIKKLRPMIKKYIDCTLAHSVDSCSKLSILDLGGHEEKNSIELINLLNHLGMKAMLNSNYTHIHSLKEDGIFLVIPPRGVDYDAVLLALRDSLKNEMKGKVNRILIPLYRDNIILYHNNINQEHIIRELYLYAKHFSYNLVFGVFIENLEDRNSRIIQFLKNADYYPTEKVFVFDHNAVCAIGEI